VGTTRNWQLQIASKQRFRISRAIAMGLVLGEAIVRISHSPQPPVCSTKPVIIAILVRCRCRERALFRCGGTSAKGRVASDLPMLPCSHAPMLSNKRPSRLRASIPAPRMRFTSPCAWSTPGVGSVHPCPVGVEMAASRVSRAESVACQLSTTSASDAAGKLVESIMHL
jgi:hypothetical protein